MQDEMVLPTTQASPLALSLSLPSSLSLSRSLSLSFYLALSLSLSLSLPLSLSQIRTWAMQDEMVLPTTHASPSPLSSETNKPQ